MTRKGLTNPYNPDDYIELHDKTAFIELCKTFPCKDQLHYPIFTMNENRVLIRSYLTKFGNLRIYEDSTPKTTKKHYNYFCDKHNNKIEEIFWVYKHPSCDNIYMLECRCRNDDSPLIFIEYTPKKIIKSFHYKDKKKQTHIYNIDDREETIQEISN